MEGEKAKQVFTLRTLLHTKVLSVVKWPSAIGKGLKSGAWKDLQVKIWSY